MVEDINKEIDMVVGADNIKVEAPAKFKLSDKIVTGSTFLGLPLDDVKEFIRFEMKLILMREKGEITFDKFMEKRKELIGDDLL